MDRALFRRLETAFPVLARRLRRRIVKEGLKPYLGDNCQAWELDGNDGTYRRKQTRSTRRAAQEILLKEIAGVG
jgi:polyphosphate kinase